MQDFETIDLIKTAVEQLKVRTLQSGHGTSLIHWNEYSSLILEYFRHQARFGRLLLLIDGFSDIPSRSYNDFAERIQALCSQVPLLHVLITSQILVASVTTRMGSPFQKVQLAPFRSDVEDIIRRLSNSGVGCLDSEAYCGLMRNRYVKLFVNSPQNLIRLMSFSGSVLDIDGLLQETMEKYLEMHSGEPVMETDCRRFLELLAVNVAEKEGMEAGMPADRQAIPVSIIHNSYFSAFKESIPEPEAAWHYILERKLLISRASSINSVMFVNRLYRYSLAADYYLKLLKSGQTQRQSLLDRFNRISAEDFSFIIVLLLKHLSRGLGNRSSSVDGYAVSYLCQITAAYVMAREDLQELLDCRDALGDILTDQEVENDFRKGDTACLRAWNILLRSYTECSERCQTLSEESLSSALIP